MSGSSRHTSRPALIIFLVIAVCACLGLGWWQWERFSSASGTGQNLGYALQWPLFAGFFLFAYFRFIRLENEGAAENAGHKENSREKREPALTEIPTGILPERPRAASANDPVLAEYNSYLAQLNATEERKGNSQ